jgi:hypothetical protein
MGAFRAVPVSAGRHEVVLTYDAPVFRAGARLSVAALVVWTVSLAALAVWRRRERAAAG